MAVIYLFLIIFWCLLSHPMFSLHRLWAFVLSCFYLWS